MQTAVTESQAKTPRGRLFSRLAQSVLANHIVSWVQVRYRMPVDLALVPFAALDLVTLAGRLGARRGTARVADLDERSGGPHGG